MTTFVKYINDISVEKAPKNYKKYLNFHLCPEWCLQEGFLPLEETEKPLDEYVYKPIYKLEEDKVVQSWMKVPEQISKEDRQESNVRIRRNEYLKSMDWRTQRYEEQKYLGIDTSDSEEEYVNILKYKQYLRDIPSEKDFPNVQVLDFEVWKSENNE